MNEQSDYGCADREAQRDPLPRARALAVFMFALDGERPNALVAFDF